MIKTILRTALVLSLLGSAVPSFAGDPEQVHQQIEDLQGNADGFAEAFSKLQEAMQADDAMGVGMLIDYPITIQYEGQPYTMNTASEFAENFDGLISQKIRDAVNNQDYGDLFVNSDGVMFGDGEVWMHLVCEDDACTASDWAIFAFNN